MVDTNRTETIRDVELKQEVNKLLFGSYDSDDTFHDGELNFDHYQ
jgi:hypothetical protein